MHMVADMSDRVGSAADSDTVSVCSVGVYGTKYSRPGGALPSSISVA